MFVLPKPKHLSRGSRTPFFLCVDCAKIHHLPTYPIMTETKPEAVAGQPTAATPANVYDHATPAALAAETKATDDVEAQKTAPVAAASSAPAASEYDDEAGKGIGIAMFICLVVGFVLGWILYPIGAYISFICIIAAIVLASTVTCGCCCGSNLKLNPKVKRWSTATLLCLVIQWVLAITAIIIAYAGGYAGDTTGASQLVLHGRWWLSIRFSIFSLPCLRESSLGVANHVVMLKSNNIQYADLGMMVGFRWRGCCFCRFLSMDITLPKSKLGCSGFRLLGNKWCRFCLFLLGYTLFLTVSYVKLYKFEVIDYNLIQPKKT
jgi:hypothetical protein